MYVFFWNPAFSLDLPRAGVIINSYWEESSSQGTMEISQEVILMRTSLIALATVGLLASMASAAITVEDMELTVYKTTNNGETYAAFIYDGTLTQAWADLALATYDADAIWTEVPEMAMTDQSFTFNESFDTPVFSYGGSGDISPDVASQWIFTAQGDEFFFAPVPSNIPEPATMSVLGLGALALLRRRRRRA
jgi:hypothetical protein